MWSGGEISVIVPGFMKEYSGHYPDKYRSYLKSGNIGGWHSLNWWVRVFEQSQAVQILFADLIGNNEALKSMINPA